MRKLAIVLWLLLPILTGLYHYGPGQRQMMLDDVADLTRRAEGAVETEDWQSAADLYGAAIEQIPRDKIDQLRRLRLEHAKAQMLASQLPSANTGLEALLDELKADQLDETSFGVEVREALASSQYYMTWLMRLEGQAPEKWEPQIDAARQSFRLLAERANAADQAEDAKRNQENLESAVRLARMDLSDLQGLPLPSQ
ncbi:MAG: hypothetical protein R3E01_07910 [Pirellulaceae bacterium]|nr:hypothetical protein [Planctomycetales bacterium]